MRRHHQAVCDCGKNAEGRFWVYILGDEGAVAEVLVICPGCGSPHRFELARGEAAGAEPVEALEGRLPQGLHEGVHARLPGAEEIRVRRRGRPRLGEPWVEAGVSRRTWYRRKAISSP
jgi:hypothetical protein